MKHIISFCIEVCLKSIAGITLQCSLSWSVNSPGTSLDSMVSLVIGYTPVKIQEGAAGRLANSLCLEHFPSGVSSCSGIC